MLLFWPTIVDGRMICLHRGLTVPIQGLAVDKYLNRKMFEMVHCTYKHKHTRGNWHSVVSFMFIFLQLKYFRSPWIHAVFFVAHLAPLIWLFYSDTVTQ